VVAGRSLAGSRNASSTAHRMSVQEATEQLRLPILLEHFFERTKQDLSHRLVRQAIKSGDLKKRPCRICGRESTQAHHSNYSKPLEIEWLCGAHHRAADEARRDAEAKSRIGRSAISK
jgi:hypothetical protein